MPESNTEESFQVINDSGRAFNVTVRESKYKFNPTVIFWDATAANEKSFGELGQMVSEYYLDTLVDSCREGFGIDLCGHVDAWEVSEKNVKDVVDFVFKIKKESVDEKA